MKSVGGASVKKENNPQKIQQNRLFCVFFFEISAVHGNTLFQKSAGAKSGLYAGWRCTRVLGTRLSNWHCVISIVLMQDANVFQMWSFRGDVLSQLLKSFKPVFCGT